MNLKEKALYHQIHPIKLLTDWITGFIAVYFLWLHNLIVALLIMLIPASLVTFLLIRFVDLEKYKESRFGKYISQYMTRTTEVIRFTGYLLMGLGAWLHLLWLILVGLVTILLAWFRGIIFPGTV